MIYLANYKKWAINVVHSETPALNNKLKKNQWSMEINNQLKQGATFIQSSRIIIQLSHLKPEACLVVWALGLLLANKLKEIVDHELLMNHRKATLLPFKEKESELEVNESIQLFCINLHKILLNLFWKSDKINAYDR